MSIHITIADEHNAKEISAIGILSFYDAFADEFNKLEDLQDYLVYTYDVKKLRQSLRKENNVYFLAWINKQPVGFAKVKKFSLNAQIESVSQMELQKIYVLAQYHGTGVGPALMEKVICLARELKPDLLWLDVHVSNNRAINFYEKNKFRKTGKHYFNIGSQTFEYHLMMMPVETELPNQNYSTIKPTVYGNHAGISFASH